MNNNRCIKCGALIPEGLQVCPSCENSTKRGHYRAKLCPICNRAFIPAPLHMYKIKYGRLVCSYSCKMEYEKRVNANIFLGGTNGTQN